MKSDIAKPDPIIFPKREMFIDDVIPGGI